MNRVLLHAVMCDYQNNVEKKKSNTKRAHTVWLYLIEVQKQEKDSGYPWRQGSDWGVTGGFWDVCHVLFIDLGTGYTGVFCLWKFVTWSFLCVVYTPVKVLKEYRKSICTNKKQPGTYYLKKPSITPTLPFV